MARYHMIQFASAAVLLAACMTPAATLSDAQKAFQVKNYPGTLAAINSAMADTKSKDQELRSDLYSLRGETMLELGSRGGAIDAFRAAQRNTQDVNKSCIAQATLLLITDSVNFTYTSPRSGNALDIKDPAARKKAFADMLDDRLNEIQPRVYKEYNADNLSGILSLLPELSDAYAIERAATGGDERMKPILMKLGEHSRDLIADELSRKQNRIEALESISNEQSVVNNFGGVLTVGPRGLISTQKDELADMGAYLLRIRQLCQRASESSARMNGPADKWDALAIRCDELMDQAAALRERS